MTKSHIHSSHSLFSRANEASRLIIWPSHWRVTHLETHLSSTETHSHIDTQPSNFPAFCASEKFSRGEKNLVKAIKHHCLSIRMPFEWNIKPCRINKSIFLSPARLELYQSIISPLRQKSVIREKQQGGCATSKQNSQAVITSTEYQRDIMLCS